MKTKLLKVIRSKYYITKKDYTGGWKLTSKDFKDTYFVDYMLFDWIDFIESRWDKLEIEGFHSRSCFSSKFDTIEKWKLNKKIKRNRKEYLLSLRLEQQKKINEAIQSTPHSC